MVVSATLMAIFMVRTLKTYWDGGVGDGGGGGGAYGASNAYDGGGYMGGMESKGGSALVKGRNYLLLVVVLYQFVFLYFMGTF